MGFHFQSCNLHSRFCLFARLENNVNLLFPGLTMDWKMLASPT